MSSTNIILARIQLEWSSFWEEHWYTPWLYNHEVKAHDPINLLPPSARQKKKETTPIGNYITKWRSFSHSGQRTWFPLSGWNMFIRCKNIQHQWKRWQDVLAGHFFRMLWHELSTFLARFLRFVSFVAVWLPSWRTTWSGDLALTSYVMVVIVVEKAHATPSCGAGHGLMVYVAGRRLYHGAFS